MLVSWRNRPLGSPTYTNQSSFPGLFKSTQIADGSAIIAGITAEDGDDLAQDVALKLWRYRDRIRSPERLPSLAYRTAVRTWLNVCRSRSTRKAHMTIYFERMLVAGKSTADGRRAWESSEIAKHVDALDPRLADVLRRHLFLKESCAVIGRALGIAKSTVHNLKRKGIQQLRARLADAGDSYDLLDGGANRRKDFRPSPLAIAKKRVTKTSIAAKRAAGPHKERGQSCPA